MLGNAYIYLNSTKDHASIMVPVTGRNKQN